MDKKTRDKLLGNIIAIEHKRTSAKLKYKTLECIKVSSKYSNTKTPIFKFNIDGNLISRNNPYKVTYKCIECDQKHTINLNHLTRKINKNITKCRICKELDEEKRSKQSQFMENNSIWSEDYVPKKKEKKIKTCKEIICESIKEFNEMDSDYIDQYFSKHLTKKEFARIKTKIISFQTDKFTNMDNFEYYPVIKCFNQTMFSPQFYDKTRDVFERPNYIKFKCEKCDNEFVNRDLFVQKNRSKIYCKSCNFCNKVFRVRSAKNIQNEKITYQSNLELKFIKFCAQHKILIRDGPKIEYKWKDKTRKYVVDYVIPDLECLVELKDDHIWHKKQVNNGVWSGKMESVNKLLKNGEYKDYLLIFPKNYVEKTKFILSKI